MKRMIVAMALTLVTFHLSAGELARNTGLYYLSLAEKFERQVVRVSVTHLTPDPSADSSPIPKHKLFQANTVYKGPNGTLLSGGTILVAVPLSAVEETIAKYGLVAGKKALTLEGELTRMSAGKYFIRYRAPTPQEL